jgi:hypothetical protein
MGANTPVFSVAGALLLRQAVLTASAGLAIGIPISIAAARLAAGAIPDLPPAGVTTGAFGVVSMLAAGPLAAYVPARRAARGRSHGSAAYE